MFLSELKKGQSGTIIRVLQSELRDKLLEMGCIPGVSVSMELKAPLGDPLAFLIDGYCLSMRKEEAKLIEINLT